MNDSGLWSKTYFHSHSGALSQEPSRNDYNAVWKTKATAGVMIGTHKIYIFNNDERDQFIFDRQKFDDFMRR